MNIIAIDFDGTIVRDAYPQIGEAMPGAIDTIKQLRREGYSLVLWTCRCGIHLARAVAWCSEQGLRFDAINGNIRACIVQYNGDDPRKLSADLYVDDRGIGGLPSWSEIYETIHERCPTYVDKVEREGFL